MKMPNDIIGVMQRGIDTGVRQHDAGDAANREEEDEADRP
ncbi:MAG: hypothetical protein RIR78_654, partial [Actinomycetota bacterium]